MPARRMSSLPPSRMTSPGSSGPLSSRTVPSVTSSVARLLELARELLKPARAHGAFAGQHFDRLGVAVVDGRLVPMLHQPTDDVAAHPPQSDHSNLHRQVSGYANAQLKVAPSTCNPASTSPLRWTRKARRPRSASISKSP